MKLQFSIDIHTGYRYDVHTGGAYLCSVYGEKFLHNRMTNDLVVCNDSEESRTTKIFQAVTEICQTFDLSEPIWLDINIRDFKRHSKTRFTQDNFIDSIDFDYLEIQVIEED